MSEALREEDSSTKAFDGMDNHGNGDSVGWKRIKELFPEW